MLGALGGVPALIPSAQGVDEGDLGQILAQRTTWVLDQSTGRGTGSTT